MAIAPSYQELAERVCAASKEICELLNRNIEIDANILDTYNELDTFDDKHTTQPIIQNSLSVEEQQVHFAKLARIATDVDAWPCQTKNRSSNKNTTLKRSKSHTAQTLKCSRDNVTLDTEHILIEKQNSISGDISEHPLKKDAIEKFNNQRREVIDINAICEKDKLILRPIFKHLPKLKEFAIKIQDIQDVVSNKAQNEPDPQIAELLKTLYEFVVNVSYLEDHRDIYDLDVVRPYEDPLEGCLEELYTQIINQ